MLVWVLCLKLWWLVLPLSTLARPRSARTYERRTTPSNLEPRDGALISDLESRNFADTVERRAGPSGITKPLIINADGEPMWMTQLLGAEDPLKPVLRQLNETDALNATQLGYGFWKSVKAREPFDFYFPPDDIPFGPRRGKYITVEGFVDDEVDEIQCVIYVYDHKIGYFDGNLDEGVIAIVNLGVAKGTIRIWRADDDYVYLHADLHFPLRVHVNHTWRLFHLPPEHKQRVSIPASAATA